MKITKQNGYYIAECAGMIAYGNTHKEALEKMFHFLAMNEAASKPDYWDRTVRSAYINK